MVERPGNLDGSSSLDEVAAERLLRGQRPAAGASDDELALGRLLAAATAPPSVHELSGEARAVAAFSATRPAHTGPRHTRHVRRRHRSAFVPRISHGVAAAAALGALTVGGVAAAAYTGSLPGSMQRLAHDHLGAPREHHTELHPESAAVTHPVPTETALRSGHPTGGHGEPGLSAAKRSPAPPTSVPASRSANASSQSAASYGLCTAYLAAVKQHDDKGAAVIYGKLAKLAGGRDKVHEYCISVWPSEKHQPPDREPQDPGYPTGHPPATTAPGSSNERPPH